MKIEIRKIGALSLGFLVGTSAITAFAQDRKPVDREAVERRIVVEGSGAGEPHDRIIFERHMQGPDGPPPPPGPGDFVFLATEMSIGGKLVKGSPYSAQAVTENIQSLSDGNRIVNRSTSAIYRDSEGRTRREQSLKAIGPFAKSGEGRTTVFINDPVAGTSFTLEPEAKVARKMAPMKFRIEKLPEGEGPKVITGPKAEGGQFKIEVHPDIRIERSPGGEKRVIEHSTSMGWIGVRGNNAKTESLGKQTIEGVEAAGTRTVVTIPAGEIGNERAIEIVSERWYSDALQTIVMSRHSDPRFGENTYRLTNISREEPARTLFEVPADYTVKEMHVPPMGTSSGGQIRMRRPAPEE